MFSGIALLLIGIILLGLFLIALFEKSSEEISENAAGGMLVLFIVGVLFLYNGANKMDNFFFPQPETIESTQEK